MSDLMDSYIFPTETDTKINDEYTPLLNQLLSKRGISTLEEAETFLNPDYDSQLHDPNLLHDVVEASDRIKTAIDKNEPIAIFSDYDCDGIPGAVILHDLFTAVSYKNFQNYIPHRHFEGFGLSKVAIDKLNAKGVKLVITIDCGTSNVEEVAYANSLGIDVIITDHHEPGEELPEAVAIVNPKLGDYPFGELCGAATVFKLAQVFLDRTEHELPAGWEKWRLDMAGIATIADMVPLVGENRVFAHYGLRVLRKSRRPGLQQLLRKARLDQRYLTEDDIGFTIGPRINAASRMDTPEDAFFMLSEKDVIKAGDYVTHLEKLNQERKTEVALMTKELHKRLKELEEIPPVLVMGHPDWRPALVGLAASKLAEEYHRPVFLWGKDGHGVYKGSCRSGGKASVVRIMEAASDVFLEHGGHHFSGGFSVKDDEIFTFSEKLIEAMKSLGEEVELKQPVEIDYVLGLDEVNRTLVEELNKLSPFGTGNHKPLFAFKNVKPQAVEVFGKGNEHTKLIFETNNGRLEGITFFHKPDQFSRQPKNNVPCTLIAHVEESFFMGRKQIRLRVVDVVEV